MPAKWFLLATGVVVIAILGHASVGSGAVCLMILIHAEVTCRAVKGKE